jgi:hypothetical protein
MVLRRSSLLCTLAGILILAGCASVTNNPTSQGSAPPTGTGPTSVSIPPTTAPATAAPVPPATNPPVVTYPPLRTSPPAPPPPPPTQSVDPASVVEAYFAAINSHDYSRAWALGGENLGQSYSQTS